MKFKVLALLITVTFLFFGCNKNNATSTQPDAANQTESTTIPAGAGDTNTETTLPEYVDLDNLPEDVIVNPDGSLELPPVEFEGGTVQPVVKPTEPPTVTEPESTEEEEPQDDPTESTESTEPTVPDYGNGNELPPDIWE